MQVDFLDVQKVKIYVLELRRFLKLNKSAVSFSLWEYGTCNGSYARRHKVNKNVQFIIFKKGDQKYVNGIGHTHDKWVDFDSSWWDNFTPTN